MTNAFDFALLPPQRRVNITHSEFLEMLEERKEPLWGATEAQDSGALPST